MARETRLSRDDYVVADRRRAGDPRLRHDKAAPPDTHVVSDLNQVVDLGPGTDHGCPDRAPIDGRVGADLHVVPQPAGADVADRRVVPVPIHERESRSSHAGPCLEHHAVSQLDAIGNHGMGIDPAPVAEHGAVADRHVRPDPALRADPHVRPNHRIRANGDRPAPPGAGTYHRCRMNSPGRRDWIVECVGDENQRRARIVHHDTRCGPGGQRPEFRGHEHRARASGGKIGNV